MSCRYFHNCLTHTPEDKRFAGQLWEPPHAAGWFDSPANLARSSLNLKCSKLAGTASDDINQKKDSTGGANGQVTESRNSIPTTTNDVSGRQLSQDEIRQILIGVEVN